MGEGGVDVRAIERLFRGHNESVVRYLTRMTSCRARAEDLAQLTWVKMLSTVDRGALPASDESGLRAYLYTVARNTFLDECTRKHESSRSRSVDPADLDALASKGEPASGPEDELTRSQTHALVRAAVGALPAEQRLVVEMWSVGTSIKAMAARCGAPFDTVLSRKKYAMARMRNHLSGLAAAL